VGLEFIHPNEIVCHMLMLATDFSSKHVMWFPWLHQELWSRDFGS